MPEDKATTNEEIAENPAESPINPEDAHAGAEDAHVDSKDTSQAAFFHSQPGDDGEIPEDDTSSRGLLRFKRKDREFSRDAWILAHIDNSQLMEYLQLEQQRSELLQKTKDIRDRRILKAFELTISLAAAVAIVFLLKDTPSILINILYIAGIVTAFWLWKNPREK